MLCDFNPLLHIIYAYGNIHFICLIQIHNTKAKVWIFAPIAQP